MAKNKKRKKNKGLKKSELLAMIVKVFRQNKKTPLNYKQIAGALGIIDTHTRKIINSLLNDMVHNERIEEVKPGKYLLIKDNQVVTGKLDMTMQGAGFISVENLEQDIYIKEKLLNHALDGDEVEVELIRNRKGKRPEGRILKVITRHKTEFVGRIEVSAKFAFVVPDNQKIKVDIFIPKERIRNAKHGEKVLARITDWPDKVDNPYGEIIDVLGMPGETDVEMGSILFDHGFTSKFPKPIADAANKLDPDLNPKEFSKRKDFRKVTTFTIDPADAKDFDDALSFKELDNGNYEVGVHIADVSHYIKPGDIIDKEAFDRATSIYLVDRVIPMLPEVLSNGICSLRPQEEKLCFSAVFEITKNAEVVDTWHGKTVIYSDRRFVYEEVQEIIEGKNGDFKNEILILNDLAQQLREKRIDDGSILFNKIEVRFNVDDNGQPTGVYLKEQKEAHKLIEDFMLLANRSVAEYVGKKQNKKEVKTYVYRVHEPPNPEKISTFSQFVTKFGYNISLKSPKSIASSMNRLLQSLDGKGEKGMLETLAIRTMSKAHYSTINQGHYGLSFPFYSHFTSPIRRYPDVIAHRLLFEYLSGGKSANKEFIEQQCEHASEMERHAAEAERDSIKYFQVKMLEDKVGEEFDGTISGVTEWGIFVEIDENKCEGLIRYNTIANDHFVFDEDNYRAVGYNSGEEYILGQSVRIQIKRADLMRKQLDFILV